MSHKLKVITIRELRREASVGMFASELPAQITSDGQVIAIILPIETYNKLVKDFSLSHKPATQGQSVAQAKIVKIPGLVMQENRIVGIDTMSHKPDDVSPKLPICDEYNFKQFKVGDKVLMRRGKRLVETVIPELDVDGNPM